MNESGRLIVGASFTGVTMILIWSVVFKEPSLTVKLRVSLPFQLAADVSVALRPLITTLICALFCAVTVRVPLSTSLTKGATLKTKLPSSSKVTDAGRLITGASFTGVTIIETTSEAVDLPISLASLVALSLTVNVTCSVPFQLASAPNVIDMPDILTVTFWFPVAVRVSASPSGSLTKGVISMTSCPSSPNVNESGKLMMGVLSITGMKHTLVGSTVDCILNVSPMLAVRMFS